MRVTITSWQGWMTFEQASQFASSPGPTRLFAVTVAASVAAQLLTLGVERLDVGANAGIAEVLIFKINLGWISRKAELTELKGSAAIT